MKSIWERALAFVRGRVTQGNFDLYFGRLNFSGNTDDALRAEVDDKFLADWIRDHYQDLLNEAVSAAAERPLRVEIGYAVPQPVGSSVAPTSAGQHEALRIEAEPQEDLEVRPFPVHPHYTFETFVVGPSNQFAHAACESVAKSPARTYNPLFVYGGTGLGKTHLLHAIAHELMRKSPGIRITYVSAEEFTNQLIKGISQRGMEAFRERYRTRSDVLLMDDVHNLAGRERTQEEFFHTFNALHQNGRQIILTSDKPPQEIPGLEERLRSRFTWGLIADVTAPELETRVAILQGKASREGLTLPDEVAFFLAQRIRSNVRELEGALIRLGAFASLTGRPITRDLALDALKNLLLEADRGPTIELIQKLVADHFAVKVVDLRGTRRHRAIAQPRSIAMYLCRKHTPASFPQIAERFGGKDHTTIIHAYRKIDQALANDRDLRQALEMIERKIPG